MPGDQDRIAHALDLYERAVFRDENDGLATADAVLDAVEADLALARGRVLHARFLTDRKSPDPSELALFERAAELYRRLGDGRGEGEARFWIGTYHQVVAGETETALPFFERSLELAGKAGDTLTMSYALRHLAFAAHAAGDLAAARERMEESTRLRRELGFHAGVAANLLGLAFIAKDDGRPEDSRAAVEEAAAVAEADGAEGVRRWIEEARGEL